MVVVVVFCFSKKKRRKEENWRQNSHSKASLWAPCYCCCVVALFFSICFVVRRSTRIYTVEMKHAQFVFVISKEQKKVICYYWARTQLRRDFYVWIKNVHVYSMDWSFNRHNESMSIYWAIFNRFTIVSKIRIKFPTNTIQQNKNP